MIMGLYNINLLWLCGSCVLLSMQDGTTALMYASVCGHVATMRVLIEYGAAVSYRDNVRIIILFTMLYIIY